MLLAGTTWHTDRHYFGEIDIFPDRKVDSLGGPDEEA